MLLRNDRNAKQGFDCEDWQSKRHKVRKGLQKSVRGARLRENTEVMKNYLLRFDFIVIDFLNELLLMAGHFFACHRAQSTSHYFHGTFNQRYVSARARVVCLLKLASNNLANRHFPYLAEGHCTANLVGTNKAPPAWRRRWVKTATPDSACRSVYYHSITFSGQNLRRGVFVYKIKIEMRNLT